MKSLKMIMNVCSVVGLSLSTAIASTTVAAGENTGNKIVKSVSHSSITQSIASRAHYNAATQHSYKWGQQQSSQAPHTAVSWSSDEIASSGYKWASHEESSTSNPSPNVASSNPVSWGTMNVADQAGYRWGIRSHADQSGYRWGIRSYAEQSGYRWGIRSNSTQSGYRWGIRSYADQSGYRWGIRNHADQSGYRWGIRTFADQAGYRWGIR